MTAETATAEILELVYHSAVISPDPWVQETHVSVSIQDILEEFLAGGGDGWGRIEPNYEDLESAQQDIKDLNEKVEELVGENEGLRRKLQYTQDLLGEYVGK